MNPCVICSGYVKPIEVLPRDLSACARQNAQMRRFISMPPSSPLMYSAFRSCALINLFAEKFDAGRNLDGHSRMASAVLPAPPGAANESYLAANEVMPYSHLRCGMFENETCNSAADQVTGGNAGTVGTWHFH